MNNQAFIDAQNMFLGAKVSDPTWKIDLKRFRVYLKMKYHVEEAYYFLGSYNSDYEDMYISIQKSGYILVFREHSQKMIGKKKGNVDTDIVFSIMRKLYKRENFNSVVLVSGDGDYYRMVKFLIEENRFAKLLMPNKKFASSLYKTLPDRYKDYLDASDVKKKIEYRNQ
ncbi:MAG: NYN domain-containing protein [Clostridiales Family XIII bacterium]|jgi:uncharacterized LabA/DUF88 family protein|nr:NYN domain-containing protein [Clostridiales Family XIII bacterium]